MAAADVKTWVPPSASPRAAALWRQNPFARFYDMIRMDDRRADEYTALLFDSFSVVELNTAVARMYDIRPLVVEKAMLEEFVIGRLASSLIRAHWPKIDTRLRDPQRILRLLRANDPAKGAVLATPQGQKWLNWTCWSIHGLLGHYARPKGFAPMAPPPGGRNPLQPLPTSLPEPAGQRA